MRKVVKEKFICTGFRGLQRIERKEIQEGEAEKRTRSEMKKRDSITVAASTVTYGSGQSFGILTS